MTKLDATDYSPRLKTLKERVGLIETKRQLDRDYLLNGIDEARNFYELRGVMRACMEKLL